MKKIVLLSLMLMLLPFSLFAESAPQPIEVVSVLQSIPQASQGALWVPVSQQLNYISTWQLFGKWGFALEGGYLSAGGLIGVLSYHVGALKDLGLDVPILNLIDFNLGFGAGVQFVGTENKGISGITATLIKVKF